MPAETTFTTNTTSSNTVQKKPSHTFGFWSKNPLQNFAKHCLHLFSDLLSAIDPHVFATTTLESQIDKQEYQLYLFQNDIAHIKHQLSTNLSKVTVILSAIQALKTYSTVLSPVDYHAGLNDLSAQLQFIPKTKAFKAALHHLLTEHRHLFNHDSAFAKQHFLADLARGIELMPTLSVASWLETLQYYRPFLTIDFYRHVLLQTIGFFTTEIDVAALAPSAKKLRDKCIAVLTKEITEVPQALFQTASSQIETIDVTEDTAIYAEDYVSAKETEFTIHPTTPETKAVESDIETDINAEQKKLTTIYAKNPKTTSVPSSATPKLLLTGLALAVQATAAAAQETNRSKTAQSLSSDCMQSLQSVCRSSLGQTLLSTLIAKNNELQHYQEAIEAISPTVKSVASNPESKKTESEKTKTNGSLRQRRAKRDSNEIPPYQEPFQVNQKIADVQINPAIATINGSAIHVFQTNAATQVKKDIASVITNVEGEIILDEMQISPPPIFQDSVYPVVVADGNKATYFYNMVPAGSSLVTLRGRTSTIDFTTIPARVTTITDEFIIAPSPGTAPSPNTAYRNIDAVPIPGSGNIAYTYTIQTEPPTTCNIGVITNSGTVLCKQAVGRPDTNRSIFQTQSSIDYFNGVISSCWEHVIFNVANYTTYCQQFSASNCQPRGGLVNLGSNLAYPKIKSLSDGRKIVAYSGGQGYSVQLVRFNADLSGATTPAGVEEASNFPSIAITPDDKVIIVYDNFFYGPPRFADVYGRYWDPNTLQFIGNPFLIHTDQVDDIQLSVTGFQLDYSASDGPKTTVAWLGGENNIATVSYSSNSDNFLQGIRARNLIFKWGISTLTQLTTTQGIPYPLPASIPTAWNPSSQLAIELIPPTGSLVVTATPVNTAVNGNNSASILISGNSYDMNAETFPTLQVIPQLYSRQPYTIQWRLVDTSNFSQPYTTSTTVSVTPVCSAPFADATQVQPQRIGVGARYTYQIPVGTFVDPNNETLTYTAYQINTGGAANVLPPWLLFDAQQVLLYSVTPPTSADEAAFQIQITATNTCGYNQSLTFDTTVSPSQKTSNLYQTLVFTPFQPLYLSNFAIATASNGPVNITLTLSDPSVGTLNTPRTGTTLSTYDAITGIWNAYGNPQDLNALNLSFTATHYRPTSILPFIDDGYNNPDTGFIRLLPTQEPPSPKTRNTALIAGTTVGAGIALACLGTIGLFAFRKYQAKQQNALTRADNGDRARKFAALLHDELAVSNIENFNSGDGYLFLQEALTIFHAFPDIQVNNCDDVELGLLAKATAETLNDISSLNPETQLIVRTGLSHQLHVHQLPPHRPTICANTVTKFEELCTRVNQQSTRKMELRHLN